MKKTLIVITLVLGFVGFSGVDQSYAQASVETFMLIPGIQGEATESRHKDWINVVSLRQSLDQVLANPNAGQSSKQRPTCEIEIVKFLDKSGPPLWAAAVTGQVFQEVRIEVITARDLQKIYELKLTNVRVKSISTATAGAFPLDSVVLSTATAVLTYTFIDSTGTSRGPTTATIDCLNAPIA